MKNTGNKEEGALGPGATREGHRGGLGAGGGEKTRRTSGSSGFHARNFSHRDLADRPIWMTVKDGQGFRGLKPHFVLPTGKAGFVHGLQTTGLGFLNSGELAGNQETPGF